MATSSAPPTTAPSVSGPPMSANCVWSETSAAMPVLLAMNCRSASTPYLPNRSTVFDRLIHILVTGLACIRDEVARPTITHHEVSARDRGGVEVLMECRSIGGCVQRAWLPVHPHVVHRVLTVFPQQRVAVARHTEDVRTGIMPMRLLVRPYSKLADVPVHRAVRQRDLHVAARPTGAALLPLR